MIKANNFVNILNATTNIANALGYGGKLFVKSYEFPEGELKIVLTTEDGKELTFKAEVKSKEEEMQQNTINQIELLDALCDQIVTAIGVAHMFGFDIQGALQEVANSNDSKFEDGKPVFNEHGKIAKGKNYFKPELAKFIKKDLGND